MSTEPAAGIPTAQPEAQHGVLSHTASPTGWGGDEVELTEEEERCLIKADANITVRRLYGVSKPKVARQPHGVTVWKAFPLQQQAFDFIDQQQDNETRKALRVYSQESGTKGQRQFIATSPEQLWRRCSSMPPASRHFYEIIRAGYPCHLYADLEFDLVANPHVDGDAQVSLLVHELVCCMKEHLGVIVDPARHVMELDSTTPTKFSRHLVIQLRRAWAHNGHVHAFMELLLGRLAAKRRHEEAADVATASISGTGTANENAVAACQVGLMGVQGSVGTVHCEDHQCLGMATVLEGSVPGPAVETGMCPEASVSAVVPGACYRNFWVRKKPVPCVKSPEGGGRPAAERCNEDDLIDTTTGQAGASLAAAEPSDGLVHHPLISPRDEEVLLIDVGVYTRNRAFRIYLSSKFGKTHALRATRRFATLRLLQQHPHCSLQGVVAPAAQALHHADRAHPSVHSGRESRQWQARPLPAAKRVRHAQSIRPSRRTSAPDLFSLIADAIPHPPSHPRTLSPSESSAPGMSEIKHDATTAAHQLGAPLGRPAGFVLPVGPADAQPRLHGILLSRGEEEELQEAVFWASLVTHTSPCQDVKPLVMFTEDRAKEHLGLLQIPGAEKVHIKGRNSKDGPPHPRHPQQHHSSALRMTPGDTPWNGLNEFVQALCAQVGEPGHVGGWMVAPGSRPTVLVAIKGNRWCGNVGRSHKSNGVYLSVDVISGCFDQRCHDPECKAYRSPTLPLPPEVWGQLQAEVGSMMMGAEQVAPGTSV